MNVLVDIVSLHYFNFLFSKSLFNLVHSLIFASHLNITATSNYLLISKYKELFQFCIVENASFENGPSVSKLYTSSFPLTSLTIPFQVYALIFFFFSPSILNVPHGPSISSPSPEIFYLVYFLQSQGRYIKQLP